MKNTTKRVWSILLAACMLVGLLSMAVFAEGGAPVIVAQPEGASPDAEGKYTFTVEAEGEGLTYEWFFVNSATDHVGESLIGITDLAAGADTATLTVWGFNCQSSDTEFYCVVSNGAGSVTSDIAWLNYQHTAADLEGNAYAYDAATHMPVCSNCMDYHDESLMAAHTYGDDGSCNVCGYDPANPADGAVALLGLDYGYSYPCGSDITITADAYGIGLVYGWEIWDNAAGEFVALTDGENVQGAATAQLTLKKVTEHDYFMIRCTVSNSMIFDTGDAHFVVEGVPAGGYQVTSQAHTVVCACGEAIVSAAHSDSDNDRVCDECDYAFSGNAPIITAHPKDSHTKNGEDATFTVAASGRDLTYQWYYNGYPIVDDEYFTGTATATLTVHSIVGIDNPYVELYDCYYSGDAVYCVVSNGQGAVASDPGVRYVEHAEPGAWVTDEFTHTRDCACGRVADEDYHEDADKNDICDICGAAFKLPFSDISDPEEWFYDATVYSFMNGIFTGEYGRFLPQDNITRGEVATVLARIGFGQEWIESLSDEEFEAVLKEYQQMYGVEEVKTVSDIDGYFYERHVRLLCAIGVVRGYENGTFRGENEISRQEMAIMLKRFGELVYGELEGITFGDAVKSFKDATAVADWAEAEVEWCRQAGVFRGDQNRYFHPADEATRAEIAQTLMRMDFFPACLLGGNG